MVSLQSAVHTSQSSMEILPLLCIVFAAFAGLTCAAGVLPDGPLIAAVGDLVLFNTTLTPTVMPFLSVGWKFGEKDIITSQAGVNITSPEYEQRIRLFISTGSLELRNVALNDTGEYRVVILPQGEAFRDGSITLNVYERVSTVVAIASSTDLVEFNSTVRLSCSASGSSLSYLWLNGSSEVTASDRVQFTDGGSTLSIVNIDRYDQGPFRCHASNPASTGTSDPIQLSISFGPENIKISPVEGVHLEGSNISLVCSAGSSPAALFYWFLNGDKLPDTGAELKLLNIQMSQSGNYSCQAFNQKTMRYETSQPSDVSVLASVTNVVVTSNTTDLVEFNSTVHLSCSASGSSLSYLWLNSSSEVTASDRVQLTDGGSTLSIVNIGRYDQGPFRCRVSNPLSTGTSDPIKLYINYGPENINLTISPSQEHFEEGSNITLYCSADSRPVAQFYWFLNGDKLPNTGPELKLLIIQMSQSGNYSCQALNNKTMRNETSQLSVVSVVERISVPSVTPSTNLIIEGNSVNLTCDAAGSVFTRAWTKDGSNLAQAENMHLYDDNRVLSFHPLKKTDSGEYSCVISNPVSSATVKHIMIVNYGPDNVQITGPSEIDPDQTLTLKCIAESTPSANLTWTVNGSAIHNSSVFTKHNIELSDSGNYTCQAMNDITGRTSSAVHELTVTGTGTVTDTPPSCSAGCIAGIVIACLIVCGAVAGGGYYIFRNKKTAKKTGSVSDEGLDNTAYADNQELNYADIRFLPNKDGGIVQLGSQSESSEYAQVHVNKSPPAAPPSYDAHLQRMQCADPDANGTHWR